MNLPDGMQAPDVASEFERLLSEAEEPGTLSVPVAQALWQLADRQWHTYELLRPDLRSRVERWIQQHWSPDPQFIKCVGGIAAQLGLPGVHPLLEKTAREFSETQFGREIRQTLSEITPRFDDPYWGMRQPK